MAWPSYPRGFLHFPSRRIAVSARSFPASALLAVTLLAAIPGAALGQAPSLSLSFAPTLALPLGEWSSSLLSLGAGGGMSLEYSFSGRVQPFLRAGLRYLWESTRSEASLSNLSASAGGGLRWWIGDRLALELSADSGYYHGLLNDGGGGAGQVTVGAGAGLSFMLGAASDLGARLAYRADFGLAHLLELSLSTRLHLSGREERQLAIDASRSTELRMLPPVSGRGLEIRDLALSEIFPVFHAYYDEHPVGTLTLVNTGREAVTGAKLSFFMPLYMDYPRQVELPVAIQAGQACEVRLNALFKGAILGVTEATKASAEISFEYAMGGKRYGTTEDVTLRILRRNALTWDDDRRAAAFVTTGDPAVLALAKGAAGAVRGRGPEAMDPRLAEAIAIFGTLDLLGVGYVVDPNSSYSSLSQTTATVDTVQFPRETLGYRGGDCDDLSVLCSALLEAAGIETAFITIPGHIFVAFATGGDPEGAPLAYSDPSSVIVERGKVWVPVEVTLRRAGFVAAWSKGAAEWKEASRVGTAVFVPVHEAWETFEPVQLPGEGAFAAPSAESVLAAFLQEAAKYADRELATRLAEARAQSEASGETPAHLNRLGILYAKFGKLEEAAAAFEKANAAGREYLPALLNLGYVHGLRLEWELAIGYYERAVALRPRDPAALAGLALSCHEGQRYARALEIHTMLTAVDSQLAARLAYVSGGAPVPGSRGEDAGKMTALTWME